MTRVLIFLIGLGLLLCGIVNLLTGIGLAIMQRPPFYGVIGIVLGVIFILLGYYIISESDVSGMEDLEHKKRKKEEKEKKEAEIRKKQFVEQELWRKEYQEAKFCGDCGNIVKKDEKFCRYCGTEVSN